jgi:lipopolysaccharide/colanic/teichoic acid biosynthesis glycosyltransferase
MNLNSQSANSSDTYSQRLADIVGTLIALITLTLPVFIIAHYSSVNVENNQPSLTYNLSTSGD